MIHFSEGFFVPFLIFAIPIIAISGGIISGIVKTLGRQRMIELAQRERIAAIERGIDPSKLPPLPAMEDHEAAMEALSSGVLNPSAHARRRAQGLMIGGLITFFAGFGIATFLLIMNPDNEGHRAWAVGLVPMFVGIAMLISALIVRPRNGDSYTQSGPGAPPTAR